MKINKIIFAVFFTLCYTICVNATINDSVGYWSLDNTMDDLSGNGFTMTNVGSTYTPNGKINGAYDFESSESDYLSKSYESALNPDYVTIIGFVNLESLGNYQVMAGMFGGSTALQSYYVRISNTNTVDFIGRNTGTTQYVAGSTDTLTTGQWYCLAGVWDSGESRIYINGVEKGSITNSGTLQQVNTPFQISRDSLFFDGKIDEVAIYNRVLTETEINNYCDMTQNPYDSSISLSYNNITINSEEIVNNTIYNVSTLNFETDVLNTSTNGNVNQTYYLYNSSNDLIESSQYATNNINGSFILSGLQYGNYSIVLFAENNETNITSDKYYFFINVTESLTVKNVTLNNIPHLVGIGNKLVFDTTDIGNLTVFLEAVNANESTAKSKYRIYYYNGSDWGLINSNFIIFNSMNGSTNNFGGLSLVEGEYYYWLETYNDDGIGQNSSNYYFNIDITPPVINNNIPNVIYNYNLTGVLINVTDSNPDICYIVIDSSNTSCSTFAGYNFTTNGNKSWTITAVDLAGNKAIETGTLLINPRIFFNFNSSGIFLQSYTFGGRASVGNNVNYTIYGDGLSLGNNSLQFIKPGYVSSFFTFNLNTTTDKNYTFNVSTAEININIRDKITGALVVGEVFNLEFIGPIGLNTTTNTGTKNIVSALTSGDYRLITTSVNYESESTFFTFTNQEQLNLTVFVLGVNETEKGTVILEVLDGDGAPIEGASVQAKQWETSTSSYIAVSEGLTAQNGQATVNIILNDKTYKFAAQKNGFSIETVEQIITTAADGSVITLTLVLEDAASPDFMFEKVISNATESFNNNTNISTITFEWINTLGTDITGCINVYRVQSYQEVRVSTNCTLSDSATKIAAIELDLNNYDYIIKAEFLQDGDYYTVASFRHYKSGNIFRIFEENNLHYYILMIMFVLSVWAGIKLQNVYIGTIGLILSAIISIIIAPTLITTSVAGLLIFIGVTTIMGASRP